MTEAKRALITGIAGQDAGHLAALLHEKGYEVYGTLRGQLEASHPRYQAIQKEFPFAHLILADLTDLSAMTKAITCNRFQAYFRILFRQTAIVVI